MQVFYFSTLPDGPGDKSKKEKVWKGRTKMKVNGCERRQSTKTIQETTLILALVMWGKKWIMHLSRSLSYICPDSKLHTNGLYWQRDVWSGCVCNNNLKKVWLRVCYYLVLVLWSSYLSAVVFFNLFLSEGGMSSVPFSPSQGSVDGECTGLGENTYNWYFMIPYLANKILPVVYSSSAA